ncbi:MAG: family 16 glycosylhydrolase [Clostridia bacterium]|nr:family 16 glycosylhydrolase [Clostridia bacterium]
MKFAALIKGIFAALLGLILTLCGSFPRVPHESSLELIWSDEFDGDLLDTQKWEGHYCGNGEPSVRRGSYWHTDMATVQDGALHIRTEYCPEGYNGNGKPGWYTCGIDTNGLFEPTYGYFECRCILPKGSGLWSAFWMISDNMAFSAERGDVEGGTDGAEIDVFESPFYGTGAPRRVTSNIHYDGYGEYHRSANVCEPYVLFNDPYEKYNTYGIEWDENGYTFYINGIKTGYSDFGGASRVPEYLILSVEVDGGDANPYRTWSSGALTPETETTDFIIDYVRAYRSRDGRKSVKSSLEGTPMYPLTEGPVVTDESVCFVCGEREKGLLYDIERVLSVTSYDGETVYEEGTDYVVKDGKLCLPEGSRIPGIPEEEYYSEGEQAILTAKKPDGTVSPLYFSGTGGIQSRQVLVTYVHTDKWDGYVQPHEEGRFGAFLDKLSAGEDVTVMFYGDSITYGADSSLVHNTAPYDPPYTVLTVDTLARLYGYSVNYAPAEAEGAYSGAFIESDYGDNGTITYVNTAVGGWTSADGVGHAKTHVDPQIEKYGCDLFVLAFGMNDGGKPAETAANCEKIIKRVLGLSPDCSVMLVSTMMPNPILLGGWVGSKPSQEAKLVALANKLCRRGADCGVARMTSVSKSILEKKAFIDYTGNNVNHPNDFFSRVYAQTLIQTLIGYDSDTNQILN